MTKKLVMENMCEEPWMGIFHIEMNGDVIFCPCFMYMKIGNIKKDPLSKIWNSLRMQKFRKQFKEGIIPEECLKTGCGYVTEMSVDEGRSK